MLVANPILFLRPPSGVFGRPDAVGEGSDHVSPAVSMGELGDLDSGSNAVSEPVQ